MTLDMLWFIPTHGDGRWLGTSKGGRQISLGYARQIAQAADELGYSGALLPTGRSCEDSWVVASSLAAVTKRLKFLVAVRPGLQTPSVSARMAATLDRMSEGRLLINVVTGGDPVELEGDGVFLDHRERYRLTDEFLTVWRGLMAGETVDFEGKHIRVKGGKLLYPPIQAPYPPLYFGGSSGAGQDVAAKHADVYLTWGEPPDQVAAKIAEARARAAAFGRTFSFGIRLHVIVRETEKEAWAAADDLIRYVTPDQVATVQATFARFDSVGQKRMAELHAGVQRFDRESLEISPNLWAGVGLVRGGAGTALVGDPETVAARIKEYAALGIDRFILSGYPHLEEAYRFAELVFPLLERRQDHNPLVSPTMSGPFGEIVANTLLPDEAAARSAS